MYIVTFTVTGKGDFPLDMLRYDHCWPYRQDDVVNLNPGGRYLRPGEKRGQRSITLATYQDKRGKKPNPVRITKERWRSFGWVVTEDNMV